MDHKARYQALVEFLLPYQDIWRNEIMLEYPRPLAAYNQTWVQELTHFIGPHATSELTQGRGWEQLKSPGLAAFHQQILTLTTFPTITLQNPLPVNFKTWLHIIPKKQHELERLAPRVADFMNQQGHTKLVDIGGGQGHLAQTLSHHYGFKTISLDLDPDLQKSGVKKQKLKWEDSPHQVQFIQHKIERQDSYFAGLMDCQTLTTGLHTCGTLAVAHMEAAVMAGASLVNMPCCYHKLDLADCNLSTFAQEHPLPLNLYALTLASGAHRKVTLEDIAFRNQIKRFRYILHFLFKDEFGRGERVALGTCAPELYYGSFALYAREQLKRLNLSSGWSDQELESYYQREDHQALVTDMLAAALIRDGLGRVIETAVILDRILWLDEQGYEANVGEIFDPQESPRNLVVEAWHKK